MRILIDGDSCRNLTSLVSKGIKSGTEVHIFHDPNHLITENRAAVHILTQGKDEVDYAILNFGEKGDVLYTQDYTLASLAKAKGIFPRRFNGKPITDRDITYSTTRKYYQSKARKRRRFV